MLYSHSKRLFQLKRKSILRIQFEKCVWYGDADAASGCGLICLCCCYWNNNHKKGVQIDYNNNNKIYIYMPKQDIRIHYTHIISITSEDKLTIIIKTALLYSPSYNHVSNNIHNVCIVYTDEVSQTNLSNKRFYY